MYILGRRTCDDDSLIYWKYIIISYSREARISNRGCLKKKESKSRDEVYVKSRPSLSLSLSLYSVANFLRGVFYVSVIDDDDDDYDDEEKFYIRTVNPGDTLQAILKKKKKKKGEYYLTFTFTGANKKKKKKKEARVTSCCYRSTTN